MSGKAENTLIQASSRLFCAYEYIEIVYQNTTALSGNGRGDAESLMHEFPWINNENAEKLSCLIVPKEENITLTEYGKVSWNQQSYFSRHQENALAQAGTPVNNYLCNGQQYDAGTGFYKQSGC